jgi:hypothetical protein
MKTKKEGEASPLPWRVFRSGSKKRESISIRSGDDYGTAIMRVPLSNIEDAFLATRAVNAHAGLVEALKQAQASWGLLHDMVSDMIERGALTESMIPDDYMALTSALVGCATIDDTVGHVIVAAEEDAR